MNRPEAKPWLPATAMAAATASTLGIALLLNGLFTPSDTELRAIAEARHPSTEVAIIPARIEVTAVRSTSPAPTRRAFLATDTPRS